MKKLASKTILPIFLALSLSSCSLLSLNPTSAPHEQQWIVSSIGEDIAEIILFAAKQNGNKDIILDKLVWQTKELSPSADKLDYILKWNKSGSTESKEITLLDFVWSPANYAPWAEQLIRTFKLKASSESAIPDSFLDNLVNFSAEKIIAENKRISAALNANPLDASLHEQAAFLLSIFALRETASCFSDVRPSLNRISTHLAIAKALKGELSNLGNFAQITLACLANRESDALSLIEKMQTGNSTGISSSFLRALKIRATNDYRFADLKQASILERLQYGRALSDDIGADYFTDYIRANKPDGPEIDWIRIGSRGINSVESGHLFAEPGVEAEMADFVKDYEAYSGKALNSAADANKALSDEAGRCLLLGGTANLQIISSADVSAYHARHLLDSIFQRYYFEDQMWGVKDDAKQFDAQVSKTFSSVRLFPLYKICKQWASETKADAELTAQAKSLLSKYPEQINATMWHRIGFTAIDPSSVPSPYTWFVPRFPMGTAFDFPNRNYTDDPELSLKERETLKSYSPYNRPVLLSWMYGKYPPNSVSKANAEDALGKLAEFDLFSMRTIAKLCKSDSTEYAAQLEKIAHYKPDEYFALGDHYVSQGELEKAKAAYELGVHLARDPLAVANNCEWLVLYYFEHGQTAKAEELAKTAAEVYSHSGLKTMAILCDKMGKLDEAEDYYKKIKERYDTSSDLCAFYGKHADQNAKYKAGRDELLVSIFPGGISKFGDELKSARPSSGLRIGSESDRTKKYGLKLGNVIVAINGQLVQSLEQYFYLMDSAKDPDIEFTVWTGKQYSTLKAALPGRRWKCDLYPIVPKG